MTQEHDQDSKTEEPTEKRISEAVSKGNVPFSREATLFGSIAAILGVLMLLGSWAAGQIAISLHEALGAAGGVRLEDREASATFISKLLVSISIPMLVIMASIAGGTIMASLLQNVPSAAVERITPRLSRISPASGWTRLFGKMGWIEFSKSVVKLMVAGTIIWIVLRRDLSRFVTTLATDPRLLPGLVLDLAAGILVPLLVLALLLAIADIIFSRFRWRRELRMTHQELRQELKEAEGDPLLKARIRSIAQQRSSRRMMDNLPTASMVITNPTHFAVALRYVRGEDNAPVVVAKGVEHLALRIREIASEHSIPLIENRPLARGLYERVDIDEQIPPDFYHAVAEIIHYLNSRGRLPRPRPAV